MSSQIFLFKENESILFARNSILDEENCHEVKFFQKSSDETKVKTDGGLEISYPATADFIIQKLAEQEFGGEFGGNENNVAVGVSWASKEGTNCQLQPTDIVRLVLGVAVDSESGVREIGKLIEEYGSTDTKLSFVVACPKDAWTVSIAGKLWAASRIGEEICVQLGGDGLEVTTKIDLSTDGLKEKVQWDESEPFNFAKAFKAPSTKKEWSGIKFPSKADGIVNMFENMREHSGDMMTGSCSLAVLDSKDLSCFWFTATPNLKQSVFKPFFFCAGNTRISPLTQVQEGEKITLLHKLHSQRKWEAIGNLLVGLEKYCVDEVMSYSKTHEKITEDVFELLKDCVEAEVKFYR